MTSDSSPEALSSWQLALRSDRKQPSFFQARVQKDSSPKLKSRMRKDTQLKQKICMKSADLKAESSIKKGKQLKQKLCMKPADPKAMSHGLTAALSSPAGTSKKQNGKKDSKAELMVIEDGDQLPTEHEPLEGHLVWSQFFNYHSYYPAMVIRGSQVNLATADHSLAFVFWFSDRKVSTVLRDRLLDFVEHYPERSKHSHGKQAQSGILRAIEELMRRAVASGHSVPDMDFLQWAQCGFPTLDGRGPDVFKTGHGFCITEAIKERLEAIGLEIRQKAAKKDRDIPNEFHEESAISAVWKGDNNITEVCIGCGDWDRQIECAHPLFEGGLCCKCKDTLKETAYAVAADGTHSYCAVCGSGGKLFVCDTPTCGKVFCVPCVEELCGQKVLVKVESAKLWKCFLCQPYKPATHGLLKPLANDNMVFFFDTGHCVTKVPGLDYFRLRRPLRVLSLFDGIGTGLLALKRAGLMVEVYYASENDAEAINVAQANHDGAIVHLGDVTQITTEMLAAIVPIDLLIGGSPCNDLSLVNPNRRGFHFDGTGVLFFDFVRVLKDVTELNGKTHLFWMFENVASMKKSYRAVISRFLKCQPAVWDAKYLSAQKRARFFWGNIPGLYSTPEMSHSLRREVDLDSVLFSQCNRKAQVTQVGTITGNASTHVFPTDDGQDLLWLPELERLFGFPAHYTDVFDLTVTKRRALLGRSWSVQVVTEIFRLLTKYFATSSSPTEHPHSKDASSVVPFQDNGTHRATCTETAVSNSKLAPHSAVVDIRKACADGFSPALEHVDQSPGTEGHTFTHPSLHDQLQASPEANQELLVVLKKRAARKCQFELSYNEWKLSKDVISQTKKPHSKSSQSKKLRKK